MMVCKLSNILMEANLKLHENFRMPVPDQQLTEDLLLYLTISRSGHLLHCTQVKPICF